MVRQALKGAWTDVSLTLIARHELLQRLEAEATDPRERSCVLALRAAMRESDRAFVLAAGRRRELR